MLCVWLAMNYLINKKTYVSTTLLFINRYTLGLFLSLIPYITMDMVQAQIDYYIDAKFGHYFFSSSSSYEERINHIKAGLTLKQWQDVQRWAIQFNIDNTDSE